MGLISLPRFAALQVLLRAVGVPARRARADSARPWKGSRVEVVSDYGVAPTFPGVR